MQTYVENNARVIKEWLKVCNVCLKVVRCLRVLKGCLKGAFKMFEAALNVCSKNHEG